MILCLLLTIAVFAHANLQSAQLFSTGHNFYLDILFAQHKYTMIVDTGNSAATLLKPIASPAHVVPPSNTSCLSLTEDQSSVNYFQGNGYVSCEVYEGLFQLDTGYLVNANVTAALGMSIENPNLHNWSFVDGDLGMSYCYFSNKGQCPLTVFQQLLINGTAQQVKDEVSIDALTPIGTSIIPSDKPLIFGIDANLNAGSNSQWSGVGNSTSSLQFGGVSEQYENKMSWFDQPTTWPIYHQFFLQDLSMCGVNLMGTWASNWQVLVDSGQVCLQLPNEFYNSIKGWLDTSGPINNPSELPAISFQMIEYSSSSGQSSSASSKFFIPLENLIIDRNVLDATAPVVNINGTTKQLCLLQSGQIDGNTKVHGLYNYPAIVFGTMALNSIYFAADFSSGSVGLSSKLNATQANFYTNGPAASTYCKRPVSCIGDQNYDEYTNVCTEPSCKNYFFVNVDPSTQECHYSNKALGWGLFFIIAICLMEIFSFFTTQHTMFSFYRNYQEEQGIQAEYGRAEFPVDGGGDNGADQHPRRVVVKLDFVSRLLGPPITFLMDFIVIHVLGWARAPDPHRVN